MPSMTPQTIYQVQKQVAMTGRKKRMYGYVAECMDKATDDRLDLFFSVFNANKTGSPTTNPDTTAMMPMFCEDSKSDAMIKRSMDMIWKAVNYLNKGQHIVAALDQSMCVIAKRVQRQWPEQYGTHRFLIILGGLKVEMVYLSTLEDWLDCSDCVAAITTSEIAEGGVAESFLSGSKVSKTRYAHQVTLCALEVPLIRAYKEETLANPFKNGKETKKTNTPSSNSSH